MSARALASATVLCCVPCMIAIAAPVTRQARTDDVLEQIVVTVNGDILTKREVDERIRITRSLAEHPEAQEPGVLTRVLRDAVDELLMMQRAAELGIDVGEDDISRVLESVKEESHVDSEEALAALLEREGMSLATLRANTRRRLVIEQVRQQLFSHISVSNEEALRYFNANQRELVHRERVTFRELRIPVPARGLVPDAVRDRALVRVVQVRDQLAGGTSFEAAASALAGASSAGEGAVIGPVALDDVEPVVRAALKGLEPGAVSMPLETAEGYSFVKLEARESPTRPGFHDNREQVMETLLVRKQQAALQDLLTRLRSAAILQWKRRDFEAAYERPSDYR